MSRSSEGPLSEFATLMAAFDTSTVFPAAMALAVHAPPEDVRESLRYLASYVIRRTVCSLDAKNLTKNTVALIDHLKSSEFSTEAVKQFFRNQKAESSRFPSNAEFGSSFLTRSVYGGGWDRRTRALLLRLEDEAQGKFDDAVKLTEDFTLEHVMPVRWRQHWPLASGEVAKCDTSWELEALLDIGEVERSEIEARIAAIDTIGNLVLVNQAKNSKLSNVSFDEKRPLLLDSPVKLTRHVGSREAWNVDAIRDRSRLLADLAMKAWPSVHDVA